MPASRPILTPLLAVILLLILATPLVAVAQAPTSVSPDTSPVYRKWNPLVGGILIEIADYAGSPPYPPPGPDTERGEHPADNWPQCTLGYAVQDSEGRKGYIVAEHCTTIYSYDDVFQPIVPYRVGRIIADSPVHDAAFAKIYTNMRQVSPRILFIFEDGSWNTRVVKGGVPWGYDLTGQVIYKTGYASETTTGSFVDYRYSYGGLQRVVLVAGATFATFGDSGAPVYIMWPGGVKIIGHVAGGSSINPNIIIVVHASGPLQALGLSLLRG